MNTWNIVTGIFGIVGVVYAIASAIAIPLYKRAKNKITTKTIVITYNAEAPKITKIIHVPLLLQK